MLLTQWLKNCKLWVHTLRIFIAIIYRFSFSGKIFFPLLFVFSVCWISFWGPDSMCIPLFQNFFSFHFVSYSLHFFFWSTINFHLSFHEIHVKWGVSNSSIWCIPYHLKKRGEKKNYNETETVNQKANVHIKFKFSNGIFRRLLQVMTLIVGAIVVR